MTNQQEKEASKASQKPQEGHQDNASHHPSTPEAHTSNGSRGIYAKFQTHKKQEHKTALKKRILIRKPKKSYDFPRRRKLTYHVESEIQR